MNLVGAAIQGCKVHKEFDLGADSFPMHFVLTKVPPVVQNDVGGGMVAETEGVLVKQFMGKLQEVWVSDAQHVHPDEDPHELDLIQFLHHDHIEQSLSESFVKAKASEGRILNK